MRAPSRSPIRTLSQCLFSGLPCPLEASRFQRTGGPAAGGWHNAAMALPALGLDGPVTVAPSLLLCGWIAVVAAASTFLCAVYLPVLSACVAGGLIVSAACYFGSRDALLLLPQSIVRVRPGREGLTVQYKNGEWHTSDYGVMLPSGFVSRWCLAVAVRDSASGRIRHLLLMPDSLAPAVFRRLRVWLVWSVPLDAVRGRKGVV